MTIFIYPFSVAAIKNSSSDGGSDCGWVDSVQWDGSVPETPSYGTVTYTYDPSGRRIEKTVDGDTTTYIYDGGNVIAEYNDTGSLSKKFIHGPYIDEPVCMIDVENSSEVYYYHYDGLGSVVALSNSSGNSCQSYEYSAFGQVAAEYPEFRTNPYLFTGRRFDYNTGLYYYRARYYNPYIGRFLQTDPIGYGAGMNWYTYCGNNPIGRTDASGLDYKLYFEDDTLKYGDFDSEGTLISLLWEGAVGEADFDAFYTWAIDNDLFTDACVSWNGR